jgi:hypothetical protein
VNTATRLGAYAAGLALVFGGAFVAAGAVVPQSTVNNWTNEAKGHNMDSTTGGHAEAESTGGHSGHDSGASTRAAAVPGVTSAQGSYLLPPVAAPTEVNRAGELSFRILDADGQAVTRFTTSHEKQLHLIVVRTDGSGFRHVHPTMDADGTWSLPWEWAEAGTYRVYADFVPDDEAAEPVTLTRTVEVAGQFNPATPAATATATVDGYTVDLSGDVAAGSGSDLTFTVSKNGKPVTDLEPYLGAFGHLVALRDGDLAFLHVHPEGDEPTERETTGPDVGFVAELPTPGRYLLYLDFQVDGTVHTAPFVVDTTSTATDEGGHSDSTHQGSETRYHTDTDTDTGSDSGTDSGDGHNH